MDTLGCSFSQLNATVIDHYDVSLQGGYLEEYLPAFSPYFVTEGFARISRCGETSENRANSLIIEVAYALHDGSDSHPPCCQAMQNRFLEACLASDFRIGMQWIPVTIESIQKCHVFGCSQVNDVISFPLRRGRGLW